MDPLVDFVNRLRDRYPNGYVPHFDEKDGGIDAEILFLFEKPGPKTDPEQGGSGFISQDNDDPTARATQKFLHDAGIDRKKIVIWNTISAWNGTVKFTAEEKRYALEEIQELLSILKNLRCIVLVGREAQKLETKINLNKYQILRSYHPSPKVKSTMPDAWEGIPNIWRQANIRNFSDQNSMSNNPEDIVKKHHNTINSQDKKEYLNSVTFPFTYQNYNGVSITIKNEQDYLKNYQMPWEIIKDTESNWSHSELVNIEEVARSNSSVVFKLLVQRINHSGNIDLVIQAIWIAVLAHGKWGVQFRHNLGTPTEK